MPTANDYQTALNDLAIAIRMSCVSDDGIVHAYEKNGTAEIIVLAVISLAERRKNEKKQNVEN